MQFHGDLLNEILGEKAHLKQNLTVSTEKGGLPQQRALTLEIATIREWFVNSGALIRWTADANMVVNGLTKDHKESRQHLARVLQNGEWFVQNQRLNQNVHAGRNLSSRQRVQHRKSCTTSLVLWSERKFFFGWRREVNNLVPSFFQCDSECCVFFF